MTLGLASGASQVPTFTWIHDQFSPDGVPLLSINFHDGKPDDVAILKQINPIPRQPKERAENIDKCIFSGNLRMESNVFVTLTGGCPFDDHFEVIVHYIGSAKVLYQVATVKCELYL